MTNKFIAIIQTGQAIPTALEKYGDFDQWFIDGMQTKPIQTQTYRVFEDLNFPDVNDLAGIIVTGSSAMVTEERNWSEATINWLKTLVNFNIPILGVCYGHQLLAKLFGGTVNWNPNGRQIGQIKISLSSSIQQDSLFSPMMNTEVAVLGFLATHQQSVTQLPKDVTLLGSTVLDPNHCFRYKKHIWGLQFHPEFTLGIIQDYIQARADDIVAEGLDPRQLIKALNNNENGSLLLKRFKNICFST